MDIEDRLRKPQRPRHITARWLGEPSASLRDVERAKANWQRLDARRLEISSRMGEFEALGQDEPA